jgi:hypothetical protein
MTSIIVEAGFGSTLYTDPADIVWTDISRYVDVAESGIQISRGASDELSTIQPGSCSMLLDNSDGRFTPGRPSSPFFPYVRKGTPLRVRLITDDLRDHHRFWGKVNQWPTRWKGLYAQASITCSDLFSSLSQQGALRSCLAQEILTGEQLTGIFSLLSAYFPLTEPSGSTSAGDLSGRGAAAIAQTQVGSGGTLEFGTEGLAATGDTSVTFTPSSATAGKYLTGDLGDAFQSDSNVTPDHTSLAPKVEVWFKTTTVSRAILGLYEPGLDHQLVLALNASGVLTVESTETGDALSVVTTSSGVLTDGQWHHIIHDNSDKTVWVDGVQVGGTLSTLSMINHRFLHVGGYRGGRLFAGQIAHVAIHHGTGPAAATYAEHYEAGVSAFDGEPADARITRLARYGGVGSVTILGSTHDDVAAQGAGGSTALSMMQDVERTESGKLYAERDWIGLAYQSRDVRYNPDPSTEIFTIEYADLETGDVELADDDQKQVNILVGSRPGGAQQRVISQASIDQYGPYDKGEVTLLKVTDNAVADALNWQISRYADPPPELREVPIEAFTHPSYSDILDGDISEFFSVLDMPDEAPTADARVTIEGYSETIRQSSHLITFRTSQSSNDSVWVLDDPTYSVLGTTTRLAY